MSEVEVTTAELAEVSPAGRAVIASLALHRVSLFPMEGEFSDLFPGSEAFLQRAVAVSRTLASGEPATDELAEVLEVYNELVEPDGEHIDEPDGPGAWGMDVLDIAGYVLEAWGDPDSSAETVADALDAMHSFADALEEMIPVVRDGDDPADLRELEIQRQVADVRAVTARGGMDAAAIDRLYAASLPLAHAYRERIGLLP
ncbi:hypothetical protein ACNPQM_27225 [Streptomyces sp. NPDC056231]|uniref:hypothetical protein n=1 Tax=Streptomyces sp. NPDC056231 TaxID=3345755 RepID=UPI003AB0F7A2